MSWLMAFLLTQILEVPVYLAGMHRFPSSPPLSWPWRVAIAVGASAVTHPLVWFGVLWGLPRAGVAAFLVAEAFAIGAEATYLRAFGVPRALLLSVLANVTSATLGQLFV